MMNIMQYALDEYKDVKADKYLGIFGDPINHTMSPLLHNTLSNNLKLDMRYIPFHITDNLKTAVNMAYEDGVVGLNITVPHKQAVMEHLVEIDHAAKVIGAVNTLVRWDGGYKGYNTDMPGLAMALKSEGVLLQDSEVIMLGAGGAARAVAYMCLNYGAAKVFIVNRTYENAKKIADDMNKAFGGEKITPIATNDYKNIPPSKYVFIQCTSVGLHKDDGLPLISDEDFYDMAKVGVDLIYNPAKTPFLKLVESKGGKAINGLGMLLHQGILAYELWNNIKIDDWLVERTYNALKRAVYGETPNIILVGYMGAGKTTIGKQLASMYGYNFLDTDEYIVRKEGMSINEIFASKGEDYFRQLETNVLKELNCSLKNTVLATGGGLPIKEDNRRLLKDLGKVFYLRCSPDTTYERVCGSNDRPLLTGDNMYQKICNMLEIRTPMYMDAADEVIETDKLSAEEIIEIIVKRSTREKCSD